jgi:hypothetical protein
MTRKRTVLAFVLLTGVGMAQAEDDGRAAAIALAKKALADRGGPEAAVEVDTAEPVDWPDAGLGCPEKGMMYAQMIVSGYRVRLKVGGVIHDVHVGNGRAVVCSDGARQVAVPAPDQPMVASAAEASRVARRQLARSLKVAEDQVQVTRVRAVQTSDEARDCGDAKATDTTSTTDARPAFWVEMQADGKTYLYRTQGASANPCEPPPNR